MMAMDRLNGRYGRGTFTVASAASADSADSAGERRAWVMKQQLRAPDYTTCWQSMPTARA